MMRRGEGVKGTMALTNSQYDSIMREYDRRQYENYRQQCARIDEIYEKIPRIREIQETMSSCSVRQAEKLMDEEPDALETLRQELIKTSSGTGSCF